MVISNIYNKLYLIEFLINFSEQCFGQEVSLEEVKFG